MRACSTSVPPPSESLLIRECTKILLQHDEECLCQAAEGKHCTHATTLSSQLTCAPYRQRTHIAISVQGKHAAVCQGALSTSFGAGETT